MNENCHYYDARYVRDVRSERHSAAVDTLKEMGDNFIVLPDEGD